MSFTIGIIDDDVFFVENLKKIIASIEDVESVVLGFSLTEVLENKRIGQVVPNVIFLDILMPGILGIDGIAQLKNRFPTSQIIILTIVENGEQLLKALCSGADGYLLKDFSPKSLENQIKVIREEGTIISPRMARHIVNYFGPKKRPVDSVLTEKNLQVLHLLAEGWAYKTIADRMGISIDGVRYHIKEIYRALCVQSIAQAVRKYVDGDLPTK